MEKEAVLRSVLFRKMEWGVGETVPADISRTGGHATSEDSQQPGGRYLLWWKEMMQEDAHLSLGPAPGVAADSGVQSLSSTHLAQPDSHCHDDLYFCALLPPPVSSSAP